MVNVTIPHRGHGKTVFDFNGANLDWLPHFGKLVDAHHKNPMAVNRLF
jgi:hypothetical protein